MPEPLLPPRVEGAIALADGREIGFAEYGVPDGEAVLWFHGTPGASRQVPPVARRIAAERGVRVVTLERPGVGASTPHLYDLVLDWTDDVDECADRLQIERFGVVGLSGGGPYALAAGYRFADRVRGVAVLGGVAPTQGDDAAPGGLVDLAVRAAPLLVGLHQPMSHALWATTRTLSPVASPLFDLYARFAPEGDRRLFEIPVMKEMFLDDLLRGSRARFSAPLCDLVLFGRHWGFPLRDVAVPVDVLHGDADNIVPLEHGRHLAQRLPRASLQVRPGESHLGNLQAADEVLARVTETR